jgi:GNAT superfamily N-acetyltransferase
MNNVLIDVLSEEMIEKIVKDLEGTSVARSEEYLGRCLKENRLSKRITYVAFVNGDAAGLVNIVFNSDYPFFRENNIPEINDLLVHPKYRRQGIGSALLRKAEETAARSYRYIGLGVGLYKDYGPAQRLYAKSGYIPDGNGIAYKNKEVRPGASVPVDDDLLIYMYKGLQG